MDVQVARFTLAAKQPQKKSTDDPTDGLIAGGICLAMVLVVVGWLYLAVIARPAARRRREQVYQQALATLAKDPQNPALRTAALAAGRAHYGGLRPDGAPTIYDEQAIMNDLVAHSGGR